MLACLREGYPVVANIAAWQMHGILLWCLAEEISARQPATAEQPFWFFPTLPIKLPSSWLLSKRRDVNFCQVDRLGQFIQNFVLKAKYFPYNLHHFHS